MATAMPPEIVDLQSNAPRLERLREAKLLMLSGRIVRIRSWPTDSCLAGDLALLGPVFEPLKLPATKSLDTVTRIDERGKILSATSWHHDQSFASVPPTWSALLCLDPGDRSVPTFFCDGAALLSLLSEGFVGALDRLAAVHEARYPDERESPAARVQARHPVVQEVEGNCRALFVSPATVEAFEGWTLEESSHILDWLYAAMNWPEVTVGHLWRSGDLLLWPNRRYLHRALPLNTGERTRRLARVVGHWG